MIGYATVKRADRATETEPETISSEPAVIVTDLIGTPTDGLSTWGWAEPRATTAPSKPLVADTKSSKGKTTQVVPLSRIAGTSKLPLVIAGIVALICTATGTYLWLSPTTPTSTASISVPAPTSVAAPAVKITPPASHPAPPAPAPAPAPVALAHGSCSIRVDANVAGPIVMVDGRAVGTAPIQVDRLFCGHRTRVAVAEVSLAPWERTIIPEEGVVVQVHASLGRLTTAIAVTSTPSGATVAINGHEVGVTPAAIPVVVGVTAHVSVSSPGYAPYEQTVVTRAGSSTAIAANLVAQLTHH